MYSVIWPNLGTPLVNDMSSSAEYHQREKETQTQTQREQERKRNGEKRVIGKELPKTFSCIWVIKERARQLCLSSSKCVKLRISNLHRAE